MFALLGTLAMAQGLELSCTPPSTVTLAPLDVVCEAVVEDGYTLESISWFFGDGGVVEEELEAAHSYSAPGSYAVKVSARLDDGVESFSVLETAATYQLCDVPDPAFSFIHKGGLRYQMVNETGVVRGCVSVVEWQVFQGAGTQGTPVDVADGWEPEFELTEEGEHTFYLAVGGLGGTGAAKLTVDAKDRVTGEIRRLRSCSQAPASWVWLALVPLLARRRCS